MCQVCLLDLDYGIPVQARDAVLGKEREMIAKSDNLEYQTEQIAQRWRRAAGVSRPDRAVGKVGAAERSRRWREEPYYNKNKAPICTLQRNACNRGLPLP